MHRRWFPATLIVVICFAVGCRPDTDRALPDVVDQIQEPARSAVPSPSDQPTLAPGDYPFKLNHGARARSYIAHVPPRLVAPAPILVALHGGGGTGAGFQEQSGLDAVADREGFIVVYPEGTGLLPNRLHTWNSGATCCGHAFDRGVDDVGFLRAVIADLGNRTQTDPDRVYMTGHSNGAMMSYRFALEAPGVVAAIAPVGGAIDYAQPQPTEPLALLHIHSADDPRALYDGGQGPAFPGTNRAVFHEPVLPGIQAWVAANDCSPVSERVDIVVGSGEDAGQRYERFVWPDCQNGTAVAHLVLHGSGHGWPGVKAPRLVQRHLGPATTLVSASEEVWAFVSQFER